MSRSQNWSAGGVGFAVWHIDVRLDMPMNDDPKVQSQVICLHGGKSADPIDLCLVRTTLVGGGGVDDGNQTHLGVMRGRVRRLAGDANTRQ